MRHVHAGVASTQSLIWSASARALSAATTCLDADPPCHATDASSSARGSCRRSAPMAFVYASSPWTWLLLKQVSAGLLWHFL